MNTKIFTIIFFSALGLTILLSIIGGFFMSGHLALLFKQKEIMTELNKEFQLKIGQTAFIKSEGLQIKFLDITGDSRCPEGVDCFWSGDIVIDVEVSIDKDFLELQQEQEIKSQLNMHKKELLFQGYSIKLIKVDPYPKENLETKERDYIASFIVEKAKENNTANVQDLNVK